MSELQLPLDPIAALSVKDAATVRSFYRRWIVSPLRRHAQVPEIHMSADQWHKINYARIPGAFCLPPACAHFFQLTPPYTLIQLLR